MQMDSLRCLLGIRRIDRVPNARIRQLSGLTKEVDEIFDDLSKLKEWGMIGLLKGYIWKCVWVVDCGRGEFIP